MKRVLLLVCLLISWLMLGCVAMDAGDDLASDEAAVTVDPPPPPSPEPPVPVPSPPPVPTPPPLTCVQACQAELATCKASATSPLAACLCQAIEARCLAGCGVMAPMPRCFAS